MIFDIDIQKMLLTFQFLFLLICVTPIEYITQRDVLFQDCLY